MQMRGKCIADSRCRSYNKRRWDILYQVRLKLHTRFIARARSFFLIGWWSWSIVVESRVKCLVGCGFDSNERNIQQVISRWTLYSLNFGNFDT